MPTKTQAKRQATKQADHATKVAALTMAAEPEPAPEVGMSPTRKVCIAYLQAHGAYTGHSRDSHLQLQQAVAAHQAAMAVKAQGPTEGEAKLAKAVAKVAKAPEPELAPEGVERVAAAKAEHQALAAWRTADATHQLQGGTDPGPRPATPNLDAINEAHEARGGKPRTGPRKASSGTGGTRGNHHNPRYAECLQAKRAGKRGAGRKLTDPEMDAYIAKVLKADPAADLAEEREIAYWLEGIGLGRPRWAAAWARVASTKKAAA